MILLSSIVASALILAQGAAVWAFLRVVTSFGAYSKAHSDMTAALLTIHESNLALHRSNMRVLEQLKRTPAKKEVA